MATYHYRFTYEDEDGNQTGPSKVTSITEEGTATKIRLYNVPREDLLNISKRHIYRSTNTGATPPATSTFKLKYTLNNNLWSNFSDTLGSVSGGAAMPTDVNFVSGTTGAANIVSYGAVTSSNSAPSSIANFPAEWYRAVVLYAAKKLCDKKLMDMRAQLAVLSDSSDASHSDPAEASQGWEKVRYYIEDDEDVELASAKAQAMGGEQAQFALDYKWLQGQRQIIAQEYDQMFQFEGMTRGEDET